MESLERKIERVGELAALSQRIIFFTGAGVSTESGIPDFRGPDGIWSKYDPDDFTIDRFLSDGNVRKLHWKFLTRGSLNMTKARPNAAHYAIADFERMGKLYGVITQNVDGLHQKAGVSESLVFQLHGDLSRARCLRCSSRYPMEEIIAWMTEDSTLEEPQCAACGGMLKPDAVFFGEPLPTKILMASEKRSRTCDLCIVLGSSLVVYPAALIPRYAQQGGAKLVIINMGPTDLDSAADIRIDARAGKVIPEIVKKARQGLNL